MLNNSDRRVCVVIPVYNAKKYLYEAVLSVLNQKYKKIEIILIDDGSCDGSSEICDNLAQRSERIFVIHQKSGRWHIYWGKQNSSDTQMSIHCVFI